MKMKHILLTTTIIAFSSPVFAADKEVYQTNTKIEKDAKGNFSEKTKTTKTELDGTKNSFDKDVSIKVDGSGNTEKVVTTETVSDPKGMGNKQVVKTKDTEKNKNGEITTTHDASVNGKSVNSDSSFEKDSNGNYERKDTITRTDAAGTKHTSEKKVSVETGTNGDTKRTTTTEKTTDPEGLGNKTSEKVTDTKEINDSSVTTTHEKKINGDVVDKSVKTTPNN